MFECLQRNNMQGFENDKFIFYTAGKIGTRTLMNTEGVRDITLPGNIYTSLRKKTLEIIINRKEITGKQIVILVRDPLSRFYSGLFELIGKILGGPYIRQIISQGGDISFLNDPAFWSRVSEQCWRFSPRTWSPNVEFDSHRWQYHVGNWLLDAEMVSEIFTDSIILNIKDLSEFLVENGIPDSHYNKYSNIIPDEYEYDIEQLFDSFVEGIDRLEHRKQEFEQYLAPEIECYGRLINSTQYYKSGTKL